jgi:hypothetical protein
MKLRPDTLTVFVLPLLTCALTACGGGGDADLVDGVIVFDNSKEYPELDLKLSDVADITYIPLKGLDDGYRVAGQLSSAGAVAYIDGDENVYFNNNTDALYSFDISGNPVRQLDRRGRGPGEYPMGLLAFWVEPESNSLWLRGVSNKIVEYDLTTYEFKSEDEPGFGTAQSVLSLNRNYWVAYRQVMLRDTKNNVNPPAFYLFSKSDLKYLPLPPRMERESDSNNPVWLLHPGLTRGKDGVFMNDLRCDTIWWINRETLEVSPRIVDVTDYPGENMMIFPSFETDQYIFLSLFYQRFEWIEGQGRVPFNEPWPDDRMFAFDKRHKKIFRIPLGKSPIPPDNNKLTTERKFAWAFDECWLTCGHTTKNSNYGLAMYQAFDLIDNIDKLPPELKEIAATLKEDDNPVLALIKFK